MADNLELAIRIRADLKSALRGLDQMERGVKGVGRAMHRGSVAAQAWQSAIGPFVAGDLIACNMRQIAAETVRAGVAADSLRSAMRAAVGGDATDAALSFVARESDRLGLSLTHAEQGFVRLSAAGVPRASGDAPPCRAGARGDAECSPRERGCTAPPAPSMPVPISRWCSNSPATPPRSPPPGTTAAPKTRSGKPVHVP